MEEVEGTMQRNRGKNRIWKTRYLFKKTREMKESLPFTIATKIIKYIGINIPK